MGPPNLSLDSSSKVPMRHSFSSADSDENTACSWRKYSCERSKQLFEVHRKLLRRVCIGIPTFIAKTLAGASLYQLNQPQFSFLSLELSYAQFYKTKERGGVITKCQIRTRGGLPVPSTFLPSRLHLLIHVALGPVRLALFTSVW